MINKLNLQRLCKKYNIKYKLFEETKIILLDSGLDEWQIKVKDKKHKPYCLLHKNKLRQTDKYHIQRHLSNLYQAIDSIANHKKVLSNIYGSQHTYKNNKYKKKNNLSK